MSWIYIWDITKNLLDFGDPDLIFKVTAVEQLKFRSMWGGVGDIRKQRYLFLSLLPARFLFFLCIMIFP